MACDVCYEDCDEEVCLSCQDEAWKSALAIGRRSGIDAAIKLLRAASEHSAATLLKQSFPE